MNWKYDHLRHVPRHRLVVLADEVMNREEFPALEVRQWNRHTLPRRVWRRFARSRLYPPDRSRLRDLEPSVLHSHFGYVAIDDVQLQAALDTPWIVSFYGADVFELPRHKPSYEAVFEAASLVLSLGPYMRDALHGLGCPLEKIRVHPLGINLDELPLTRRTRRPDQPLKILFAGTFRQKKGVPYLLQAVSLLRAEGHAVQLHLIGDATDKPGDSREKERIHRLIEDLDLRSVVRVGPFLPFRELVELAVGCHVLAAPSITADNGDSEGTPFIIQQMMGTGMPVISTLHSDIPFVFGSLADRLVPERDAEALAGALLPYAADPGAAERECMLFRRHVEEHLDVRVCASRLADMYDEVAG